MKIEEWTVELCLGGGVVITLLGHDINIDRLVSKLGVSPNNIKKFEHVVDGTCKTYIIVCHGDQQITPIDFETMIRHVVGAWVTDLAVGIGR